jgi:hypothetical protein
MFIKVHLHFYHDHGNANVNQKPDCPFKICSKMFKNCTYCRKSSGCCPKIFLMYSVGVMPQYELNDELK